MYRLLIDNAREGIVIVQDGIVRFANPRSVELLRRPESTLIGMEVLDITHPDDHVQIIERRARRERGEPVPPHAMLRLIRADGEILWVEYSSLLIDWNGAPAVLLFLIDVTERRKAEDDLRRSEERYRSVVENMSEGLVVAQDGRIVFANTSTVALSGYSLEELYAMDFINVAIHPEDRPAAAERFRRRMMGEEVENRYSMRIVCRDGSHRWVDLSAVRADWQGRPATHAFLFDATERRAMEQALRRSEANYRQVIECSPIGVAILRGNRLKLVNQALCRTMGCTEAELLAVASFLDVVHEDDVPMMREHARTLLNGDCSEATTIHFRIRTPRGGTVWVEGDSVQVEWQGKPATLSFVHDVTERVRLEEHLKQTLAERELVLERSNVGIAFLDPKGRLRWANSAMSQIFGAPMEDVVGGSLEPYYPSRDAYLATGAAVSAAVLAGRTYESELQMQRADGTPFWVHLSGRAVQVNDLSKGTVWAVMDIDRRKQAEAEIRTALEKQQELNYLKSRFVSMTSHEFRTPLATILSSTELLKYYADRLPAEEKTSLLDTIEKAVRRMTRMLDDVLLIGKVEADRLDFKPTALDLRAFCSAVAEEAAGAERIEGRRDDRIALVVRGADTRVALDEKLTRHILGNLLSNALKYSPESEAVSLTVDVGPESIRFVVEDRGIGIPPDDLPHLFETFHRARNVGNIQGTGLGLAIVKKAVELHRGRIEVASELGRGTKFLVTLPR